jgi:hypothetical protein
MSSAENNSDCFQCGTYVTMDFQSFAYLAYLIDFVEPETGFEPATR